MEEIWKPVPIDGLRERYEVSNLGEVRRVRGKILTRNRWGEHYRTYEEHKLVPQLSASGYIVIGLRPPGGEKFRHFSIHRLVALAFIPNPTNRPCIDHIDGDRQNNRVDNLRWCTLKENVNNPITLQRHSRAAKGNKSWSGKHHSEATKQKISMANKGRVMSKEACEKVSKALSGRKMSEEQRLLRCKPIGQYALDGTLIRTWTSGTDAARALGIGMSNILSCANPNKVRRKTAGGFIWKYI